MPRRGLPETIAMRHDEHYVEALAAPFTVDTMPDQTLEAFADHGTVGEFLPADGGDADQVIAAFAQAGIDTAALAAELQRQGAEAFAASWLAAASSRHSLSSHSPGEGTARLSSVAIAGPARSPLTHSSLAARQRR